MTTMNDLYADGSEHEACDECGYCKRCGDCKKFGCVDHDCATTSESGEPKYKADRTAEDLVSNQAEPGNRPSWVAQ